MTPPTKQPAEGGWRAQERHIERFNAWCYRHTWLAIMLFGGWPALVVLCAMLMSCLAYAC